MAWWWWLRSALTRSAGRARNEYRHLSPNRRAQRDRTLGLGGMETRLKSLSGIPGTSAPLILYVWISFTGKNGRHSVSPPFFHGHCHIFRSKKRRNYLSRSHIHTNTQTSDEGTREKRKADCLMSVRFPLHKLPLPARQLTHTHPHRHANREWWEA